MPDRLIHSWHSYRMGDDTRRPILFLHGFMGSGKIWLPIFEQLQNDFYCLSLDLPGHGQTKANLDNLTFNALALALKDFISEHCSTPPVLVGYSMGGRIALYTALAYPDTISALVLESTTAGIADAYERKKRLLHDMKISALLRKSVIKSFLIEWYKQPVFAYLRENPGLIERIIEKKSKGNPSALSETLVKLSPGNQPPLWSKLAEWTKPALIIAGKRDAKYCEIGDQLKKQLPNSRLEIINGAGHIVHLEKHKDFMSALKSFLT